MDEVRRKVFLCIFAALALLAPRAAIGAAAGRAIEARNACVLVMAFDRQSNPLNHGSGFILTGSGVVVTNRHVVELARQANGRLAIILPSGTEWAIRNAVNADVAYLRDLAIVRTGERCTTYLKLADSDSLRAAQRVYAIGTPLSPENFNTITGGVLIGLTEEGDVVARVEVHPGNSGGPLVDEWGRVIGVVTAKSLAYPDIALAIASSALEEFAGVHTRRVRQQENVRAAEQYFSLGQQAEQAGRTSAAIKYYETTLTHNPRHERAHFALGRLYQKSNLPASVHHYSRWLKLAPGRYPDAEIARIRAHVQSIQRQLSR